MNKKKKKWVTPLLTKLDSADTNGATMGTTMAPSLTEGGHILSMMATSASAPTGGTGVAGS